MMNLNHLYSFYVCAEHLNFSKAASVIGITQPSLSQQIKNLETELGTPLFLRNGKNVSLTTKGEQLLKTAQLYYDFTDEVQKCIVEKPKIQEGRLQILVSDQLERPFVAELAAKIAKRDKRRMLIFSLPIDGSDAMLKKEDADFIITPDRLKLRRNFIKVDFPVFFVTSSSLPQQPTFDHPSNIHKMLDYFGESLVVPSPRLTLGKEYLAFKKKHQIKQEPLMETDIVACMGRFVASGTGCSFLPLPYIKSYAYKDHLHLLGPREGYWKHSIYIYADLSNEELEMHPLVKYIKQYGAL